MSVISGTVHLCESCTLECWLGGGQGFQGSFTLFASQLGALLQNELGSALQEIWLRVSASLLCGCCDKCAFVSLRDTCWRSAEKHS